MKVFQRHKSNGDGLELVRHAHSRCLVDNPSPKRHELNYGLRGACLFVLLASSCMAILENRLPRTNTGAEGFSRRNTGGATVSGRDF